ncbi:ammonium transporter [soil metagenome]
MARVRGLRRMALFGWMIALAMGLWSATAFAQDSTPAPAPTAPAATATVEPSPDGSALGDKSDSGAVDEKGAVDTAKLADTVGHNKVSINFVWTLVAGFLVMFMQAGFAMVEAGFCRAKHAAHVIMTNFMIYPIGMLGFWAVGFALMYGSVGGLATLGGHNILNGTEFKIGPLGLFGTKGFFLNPGVYDASIYAFFLFQMVFMDTTATIPTGAMAERWRFSAFVVYGFFVGMICYPIYGHWVWGGGFLSQLGNGSVFGLKLGHGAVDFAGSSVVHAVGGFLALAGSQVLGPRLGKFNKDGSANVIPGHHIPMAVIGTFILCFGWFGFNPGSTLAGTDLRIAVIATNTMLASAGGALAAALFMHSKTKKWDPGMMVNGMLAGLVAITAPCAFIDATSSVVVGIVAGLVVIWSIGFFEKKGIDDPVGAISVHGVCGVLGVLMVGIFADGSYGGGLNGVDGNVKGILHGDTGQFFAQVICSVVVIAWAYGSGLAWFKLQSKFQKLRPTAEEELGGLDLPEMGMLAYPEFNLQDSSPVSK